LEVKKTLDDDRILIAGAIGVASTVVGEIGSWILLSLGVGKYSVYQENSLIVTYNTRSMMIGFILNVLIGSIIGATVYLTTKKWGHRHIIMVSLFFTMIAWLGLEIITNAIVDKNIITSRLMSGYYNSIINAIAHAVFKALMIKRFIFSKM
jgi:hypothetical protein